MDYYSELDAASISGSLLSTATTSDRFAFNLKAIAARIQRIGESLDSSNEDKSKRVEENVNVSSLSTAMVTTTSVRASIETKSQQNCEKNSSSSWSSSSSSSYSSTTSFLDLPIDVLAIIILNLDFKSFFNLRSTCKSLRDLCTDERFYRHLDLQPYWSIVRN